jgi:hypothetical protein
MKVPNTINYQNKPHTLFKGKMHPAAANCRNLIKAKRL